MIMEWERLLVIFRGRQRVKNEVIERREVISLRRLEGKQ
jgi:hypothetical protein